MHPVVSATEDRLNDRASRGSRCREAAAMRIGVVGAGAVPAAYPKHAFSRRTERRWAACRVRGVAAKLERPPSGLRKGGRKGLLLGGGISAFWKACGPSVVAAAGVHQNWPALGGPFCPADRIWRPGRLKRPWSAVIPLRARARNCRPWLLPAALLLTPAPALLQLLL
jgi:hypothetical protein